MSRRIVSIFLLLVLAFQASLAGARGSIAICFGGGHEHDGHEQCEVVDDADDCAHACTHDAVWPVTVPAEKHGFDCTCNDVELISVDLLTTLRDSFDAASIMPGSLLLQPLLSEYAAGDLFRWRGPPERSIDDHGVHARLAVVRTTRFLL